jgi:hypothetical protein
MLQLLQRFTDDPLSNVRFIHAAVPLTTAYKGTVLLLYVALFTGLIIVICRVVEVVLVDEEVVVLVVEVVEEEVVVVVVLVVVVVVVVVVDTLKLTIREPLFPE